MTEFTFENKNHYINFCLKILRSRNLYVFSLDTLYRDVLSTVYQVSEEQQTNWAKQLSYQLSKCHEVVELESLLQTFQAKVKPYRPAFQKSESVRFFRNKHARAKYTRELLSFCECKKHEFGIYFLYNTQMQLLYVGKSTESLGYRLLSSIRERRGTAFASIAYPQTKSDTHVYELYYIAKFRPPLNSDCSELDELDELTISLPELELTAPMEVYQKGIEK